MSRAESHSERVRPMYIDGERRDTGAHRVASELAAAIVEQMHPMDTGDVKRINKRNWAANTVIALVVASAGAFAAYKATEARSVGNERGVIENKRAIRELDSDIADVRRGVDSLGQELEAQGVTQERLADGIEQLTKEAKTREEQRLRDVIKSLQEQNDRLRRRQR